MKKLFILFILIFFTNGLSQSVKQELQPFGLQAKVITSLTAEQSDYNSNIQISDYIFVGTENGIFRSSAISDSSDWVSMGLENKSITALTVQHWGVGPADGLTLFAAVIPEEGDSTLIFKREVFLPTDTNWVASDSGIDKSLNGIYTLNSYYFSGHEPPQPILAGGSNGLFQASWTDYFWSQSAIEEESSQPVINAIDVAPHWWGTQSGIAWAVGYSGSALDANPIALRSTDQGLSWKIFNPSNSNSSATSVVINTRNSDSVYVSWNNCIYLTSDNGESWETVFTSRGDFIHTLAIDPLNPENVFAGGLFFDDSPPHLKFGVLLHSTNGGKYWDHVDPVTNVLLGKITSIAVVNKFEDDNTYVFIGTAGTGIWRYRYSIITGINENKKIPGHFILSQNYPNPFNPSTKIKFVIPKSSFVNLKIYDVLGREVSTLVNEEKHPGSYEVEFSAKGGSASGGDAHNLSSGIYFYKLQAGSYSSTKKMIYLK